MKAKTLILIDTLLPNAFARGSITRSDVAALLFIDSLKDNYTIAQAQDAEAMQKAYSAFAEDLDAKALVGDSAVAVVKKYSNLLAETFDIPQGEAPKGNEESPA